MEYTPLASQQTHSEIPAKGFVRLAAIIAPYGPLPISRSTWFAWRRMGKAPAPVMLSPRISAYRAEDVRALLDRLDSEGA